MRCAAFIVVLVACEPPEEIPERPIETLPDVSRVRVEPSPVDFGLVPLGEELELRVRVYNETDEELELRDVTLNPAGEAVSISMDFHNDIAYGLAVAPGDSYRFELTFVATAAHVYEGELELVLPGQARKFVEVIGEAGAP